MNKNNWIKGAVVLGFSFFIAILLVKPIGVSTQFSVLSGIVHSTAAEVSDERSAYMTREHNNSRMITIGSKIVGEEIAWNIVKEFLSAKYDGGRHQIRVDMLNKMA